MGNTAALGTGDLLIGEKRVASTTLGRFEHRDPSTGRVQGDVAQAGPEDIDLAVSTARTALDEWRTWNPGQRRDVLSRIADVIDAHASQLAEIGILENGTPRAFAAFACADAPASWFRYYAGWADKLEGRSMSSFPAAGLNYTLNEPLGVLGLIIAFNGPTAFVGMKVAPALAAGNTVVLKPSVLAPWSTLRLGELFLEAGLPPGVVNVLPGDGRAGGALAGHGDVDKISFTGGAETATAVLAAAARNRTPAAMELGGKSASIIFEDADLDSAAATAVQGSVVLQSGQACVAGTRILVQRSVYDEVISKIVGMTESLSVGAASDSAAVMGPLINQFHTDRVLGVINKAAERGEGTLLCGGERLDGPLADGYFVSPAVFGDVDPTSDLAREEIFGPVASVIPFDSEAEAVALANDSRYGLAGYVFTRDVRRAHSVARDLQTGYISVNGFNMMPPYAPFGGTKDSGFGREGGLEGLLEMCQTKNIFIGFQ
jgi:aldehyde dehydrogenase (NAD+)